MSAPAISDLPAAELYPDGTVECGCYPSEKQASEHSLVALAMGEECWIIESDRGHHLLVRPAALASVAGQLRVFDRESVGWPPLPVTDSAPARGRLPLSPLLWVVLVFATFRTCQTWPDLVNATLLDARQVFEHGEWWRAVTALFLHADLAHLISNTGGGLLVFSAVVATFGLGAGWGLIALSAVAGNLAAVTLHFGDDYRSLGSSTAIFAALGLLTGRALRTLLASQRGQSLRWRSILFPPASGLVVLGLYGAGGVNIDVLAHATGFVAGLVSGFTARRVLPHRLPASNRVS